MKNIKTNFVIFILVLSTTLYSQFRLGAFGGINSTGFAGDDPPRGSFSSDIGYELGVIAEYHIFEDIAINIQPVYSNRSTQIQYDVKYQYEPYDSIRINFDNIEFPINVKVIADNQMSYVTAGILFAIPVDAMAVNNTTGNEILIEERLASYVWKANFGVGIQFHIGRPLMFIDLSYTQSLTNLTESEIEEINLKTKIKSSSIQLNVGILFTL